MNELVISASMEIGVILGAVTSDIARAFLACAGRVLNAPGRPKPRFVDDNPQELHGRGRASCAPGNAAETASDARVAREQVHALPPGSESAGSAGDDAPGAADSLVLDAAASSVNDAETEPERSAVTTVAGAETSDTGDMGAYDESGKLRNPNALRVEDHESRLPLSLFKASHDLNSRWASAAAASSPAKTANIRS